MNATPKPTVSHIEDHEGTGECSACPRTGLRWIVVLSDGTKVGTECAKKITGTAVAATPKSHGWIHLFEVAATHVEHGVTYALWKRIGGTATRETRNGHLTAVGGVEADWIRRGWNVTTTHREV